MAFVGPSLIPAAAARPLPEPQSPPRAATPDARPILTGDSIARPVAQPSPLTSPPSSAAHAGAGAMVPVLAAGVLVGGAAVIAAPAVLEGAAFAEGLGAIGEAVADGAGAIGSAVVKGRGFLAAAGRALGAEYRAAAAKFAEPGVRDPQQLGKALGAQAWTATEEFGRGSIVGAGLTGGAWAAHQVGAKIRAIIDAPTTAHRS